MAAKGSIAKENVIKKIKETFGSDYIAEQDKKIYVWADDGGSRVQIAISMTCPKTSVGASNSASGGMDFESMTILTEPSGFKAAEITPEEERNIEDLMKKLGL